jgi:hypothetical protein
MPYVLSTEAFPSFPAFGAWTLSGVIFPMTFAKQGHEGSECRSDPNAHVLPFC